MKGSTGRIEIARTRAYVDKFRAYRVAWRLEGKGEWDEGLMCRRVLAHYAKPEAQVQPWVDVQAFCVEFLELFF